MSKYYSLEDLLEAKIGTWCDMYDLEEFLGEIPEDKVLKIIRCKDCKYYKVGNPNANYCYHERYEHHGQGTSYAPDDFCSYAEPKKIEGGGGMNTLKIKTKKGILKLKM